MEGLTKDDLIQILSWAEAANVGLPLLYERIRSRVEQLEECEGGWVMPAQIYGMTQAEDFVVALEYTGQDCKVHHLDDKGGVDLIADAVVLAITPTTVVTLCRGAELPFVFDRNTLQHVDIDENGELYVTGDYELRGIPNVTIQ